jgi:uncharacterized RDD family membrane protein YckC
MDSTYKTPESQVLDETNSQPVQYAGFWIRLLASIVDTLISAFILLPALWAIYGGEFFTGDTLASGFADLLINYLIPAAVVILFWVYKSATPGKMICGIVIVDADTGDSPKVLQCVLRYIGYYVSALIFLLGFFWVIWDKSKQGWHDKIASTVVIKR